VQNFFLQRTDLCYLSLFLPSISTLVSILSVINAPGIWSFRREEFVLHQLDILDLILFRIWKNCANKIFCFRSRWLGCVNAVYTSHYDIPNVIRTGVLISEALGIVTEGHIIMKRYSRQFNFMQMFIMLFSCAVLPCIGLPNKVFPSAWFESLWSEIVRAESDQVHGGFCLHKELKSSVNRLQLPKSCCEIVNRVQGVFLLLGRWRSLITVVIKVHVQLCLTTNCFVEFHTAWIRSLSEGSWGRQLDDTVHVFVDLSFHLFSLFFVLILNSFTLFFYLHWSIFFP
jgi:hypothetical protein